MPSLLWPLCRLLKTKARVIGRFHLFANRSETTNAAKEKIHSTQNTRGNKLF